ncbi:MAG: hypothetical protein WCG27_06275, partial [Pseudomonadota bacterium]
LAVPWMKLFNFHPVALIVFEWSWIVVLGVLVCFLLRKRDKRLVLFALALIVFNRGLVDGLAYMAHPTLWSMVPAFLLVYYIHRQQLWGILICAFILCLFKEIFPFGILGLSFYYLWQKKWQIFVPLLAIALIFIYIKFVFLSAKQGGVDYLTQMTSIYRTGHNPITAFFLPLIVSDFWKLFLPFVLPIAMIIKTDIWKRKKWAEHPLLPVAFYLAPLFGIYWVANVFYHWHGVVFAAPLMAIIFLSTFFSNIGRQKILAAIIFVIFLIPSAQPHAKVIKLLYFHKSKTCIISKDKEAKTLELRKTLAGLPPQSTILATSGIIPWAYFRPQKNFKMLGWPTPQQKNYDFLVIEHSRSGIYHPYSVEDTQRVISACSETKQIISNDYFFMAQGPFSENCIKNIHQPW